MGLKKELTDKVDDIYSLLDSATLLFESEKIKESVFLLATVFEKYDTFFQACGNSGDEKICAATEQFINTNKEESFWYVAHKDNINELKDVLMKDPRNKIFLKQYEKVLYLMGAFVKKTRKYFQIHFLSESERKRLKIFRIVTIVACSLIAGAIVFAFVKYVYHNTIYGHKYLIKKSTYLGDFLNTGKAEAYIQKANGEKIIANLRGGKLVFPGLVQGWQSIKPEKKRVNDIQRKALWIHPTNIGSKSIVFKHVTIGNSFLLIYGLADGCWVKGRPGVEVEINIDNGNLVKNILQENKREDWNTVLIDTRSIKGKTTDITITVSSEKEDGRWFLIAPYVEKQ